MIPTLLVWTLFLASAQQSAEAELSQLLPQNLQAPGKSQLLFAENANRTRFVYTGTDGVIEYCLQPGKDFWGAVIVKVNRIPVATILDGAAPRFQSPIQSVRYLKRWADGEVLHAEWEVRLAGREHEVEGTLQLVGESMVVAYSSPTAPLLGVSFGPIQSMAGMEARVESSTPGSGCSAQFVILTGVEKLYASVIPGDQADWDWSHATAATSDSDPGNPGPTAILTRNGRPQNSIRFYVTLAPHRERVLPPSCQPDTN